jgi:hypothetical protein
MARSKGLKTRVTRAMQGGAPTRGSVSTGIRESGHSERAMFPRKLRGAPMRGVSERANPTRGLRGPSRG